MHRARAFFFVCAGFLCLALASRLGVRSAGAKPASSQQSTDYSSTQRVGHPQVLIPGATRDAVADAIANRLSANGWTVTKATDYGLELEQPAKSAAGFFRSILSVKESSPHA